MAQTNPILYDVQANIQKTIALMEAAHTRADLLVFPELSLTGYLLKERTDEVALTTDSYEFKELCRASRDLQMGVMIGFVEEGKGCMYYNSSAYIHHGEVKMVHRKIYLPTYGAFEEGKYFAKGQDVQVMSCGSFDISMLICADLWQPSLVQIPFYKHTSLLVGMINSSEAGLGNTYSNSLGWERVGQFYASMYGCYVVLVNRVGQEDSFSFFGNSLVFDPFGQVLERCKYHQEDLKICTIDFNEVKKLRKILPTLRNDDLHFTIRQLTKVAENESRR